MDFKENIQTIFEDIKDSLGIVPKDLVGLRITQASVKAAFLKISGKKKKYELVDFVSLPVPDGIILDDQIQDREKLIEIIKEAFSLGNFKTKYVVLGVSGKNTIVKNISFAAGTVEEVEDQVLWEAEQYIPFDVDKSLVSFDVIGKNEGGGLDAVLVAADSNYVLERKSLVEDCGLRVKIVDLTQVALTNLFTFIGEQGDIKKRKEKESIENEGVDAGDFLISFGAQYTIFIICKKNEISFSKQIDIGGISISEEIQRQMGVTLDEANNLKVQTDENGNLPEEIFLIIKGVLNQLFEEIRKTKEFYVTSTSHELFLDCYVTGGSIRLPGFMDGLSEVLGVPVQRLEPFKVIAYNEKKFSRKVIDNIEHQGLETLGLAMRRLDD